MPQMKLFGNSRSAARVAGRRKAEPENEPKEKKQKKKKPLKVLAIWLTVILCLEGLYFFLCYTQNSFVKRWRTIYIQTAMSTMRHQWLATAFIPRSVIDKVVAEMEAAREEQIGVNSEWDEEEIESRNPTLTDTKGMSKEEIKILLVDDEKQFVDTLAERLAMRGFSARVAYDGPPALKAVEEPTDVIVLDLRMPGMDGFEVLRSVKKSNPQVQVIILTGHGGDAEEQTAYRMGAYNFLKKPMDIDELLNSIRMAYRDKVENAMVAVSLAEGGDFDAAQDVLNEKDLLAEHKL